MDAASLGFGIGFGVSSLSKTPRNTKVGLYPRPKEKRDMEDFQRVKKATLFEGIDTLTKVSIDRAHGPYPPHVDVITWAPGFGQIDKRRIAEK